MKGLSNALSLFLIAALRTMALHENPEPPTAADISEDDLFCMIQNVYHESRGEELRGQATVAHVTLTMVRSPASPHSVCDGVWQKDQFIWTGDGKSDHITDLEALGKAVDVALASSRGRIKDPTGGALHDYAHDKGRPSWSRAGHHLIVGEHTLVRMAGR